MSSDFEGYEQDFSVLSAEITSKISRVPRLPPDEKKQMVANVEKQLEEARELLEQMDLEVREIPPQSRGMYSNRMRSYKQEMGKLEADFFAALSSHKTAVFAFVITLAHSAGKVTRTTARHVKVRPCTQTVHVKVRPCTQTEYTLRDSAYANPPEKPVAGSTNMLCCSGKRG
ncbi:hypothetical protein STEG23_024909 [Scotinomys teguina]